MLIDDLNVFFNEEEFAERHVVNEVEMTIVVDNDKLVDLKAKSQYASGISSAEKLIIVQKTEFGSKPAVGQIITVDDDIYRVVTVEEPLGVFEITLEANY